MKKLLLLITVFSFAIATTHPPYGPYLQWSPISSPSQSFVIFGDITLNGEPVDSGELNELLITGTCGDMEEFTDSNDNGFWDEGEDYIDSNGDGLYGNNANCDMLGAIYNGNCIAWSYMPMNYGETVLMFNLNDGVGGTGGIDPSPTNNEFYPAVS